MGRRVYRYCYEHNCFEKGEIQKDGSVKVLKPERVTADHNGEDSNGEKA